VGIAVRLVVRGQVGWLLWTSRNAPLHVVGQGGDSQRLAGVGIELQQPIPGANQVVTVLEGRYPDLGELLECQLNKALRKLKPSVAIASCVGASLRQIAAARAIAWFSMVNDSITIGPS
jgi:hypothetical protein